MRTQYPLLPAMTVHWNTCQRLNGPFETRSIPCTSGRFTGCPIYYLWDRPSSGSQYIAHHWFVNSPVLSRRFHLGGSPVEPKRRQTTDGLSVTVSQTYVLIGFSTQTDLTNGTEYSAGRTTRACFNSMPSTSSNNLF